MGQVYVKIGLEYLGVPYSVEASFNELEQMDSIGEIIDVIERKIAEMRRIQPELTEERVTKKKKVCAASEEE